MNGPETARAAYEWRQYQRSPAYARDKAKDAARRAELDRKAGHLPACTLSRCTDECPRATIPTPKR